MAGDETSREKTRSIGVVLIDWTEPELIELWSERAAIREHDGGMSREEAEESAYYDWRKIVGPGVSVPVEIREKVRKFK